MFLNKKTCRICDKKNSSGKIRVRGGGGNTRINEKIHVFSRRPMEVVVSWFLINDKTCLGGVRTETHQGPQTLFLDTAKT